MVEIGRVHQTSEKQRQRNIVSKQYAQNTHRENRVDTHQRAGQALLSCTHQTWFDRNPTSIRRGRVVVHVQLLQSPKITHLSHASFC